MQSCLWSFVMTEPCSYAAPPLLLQLRFLFASPKRTREETQVKYLTLTSQHGAFPPSHVLIERVLHWLQDLLEALLQELWLNELHQGSVCTAAFKWTKTPRLSSASHLCVLEVISLSQSFHCCNLWCHHISSFTETASRAKKTPK